MTPLPLRPGYSHESTFSAPFLQLTIPTTNLIEWIQPGQVHRVVLLWRSSLIA